MITRKINAKLRIRECGSTATGIVLLVGLAAVQLALGQESGTVTVDVAHCFELESAAARRDCLGAQVDEVLEGRGSDETDNPSPVIENAEANDTSRTPDTDEYHGTIVSIRERLPSSYIITLDNGQIWEQTEPKQYPLRPGLEVRIYPTRWGRRYRLSGVGSGGHIQVQRLR